MQVLCAVTCCTASAAAFPSFYVSSSTGDDGNDGTSPAAPWRTTARVQAAIAAGAITPSSSVQFLSGDTFDPLDVSGAAGAIFTSYGDGESLPTFSGAQTCMQWTPDGDGSFACATIQMSTQPLQPLLVANGSTALVYARWPNADAGFSRFVSVNGTAQFLDPTIPAELLPALPGATVRLRAASYFYGSATVVDASAGGWVTLSAFDPPGITLAPGTGYFMDGTCVLMDTADEWCISAGGTVRLLPPQGWTPVAGQVALAVQPNGVSASAGNCSGVTLAKLAVTTTTSAGIWLPSCDTATVVEGSVSWSAGVGVAVQGMRSGIGSTNVSDSACVGITVAGGQEADLVDNQVLRSGNRPGYGCMGAGQGVGIVSNLQSTVEGNRVDVAGYHGIAMAAGGTYVHNTITNVCTMLNDGGALYLWGNAPPYNQSGLTIRQNLIINVTGNTDSMPPGAEPAWGRGIYLDDRVHDAVVSDNVIISTANAGILLHGNWNVTVTGNIVVDSAEAALLMQDEIDEPLQSITVANNTLVAYGWGDGPGNCVQQASRASCVEGGGCFCMRLGGWTLPLC